MTTTKKCPHCDCALEFVTDLGERMVFTAHDEKFCALGTRLRVQMLESALVSLPEAYERAVAANLLAIDAALAKRGLPPLAELLRDDVERARTLRRLSDLECVPMRTMPDLTSDA